MTKHFAIGLLTLSMAIPGHLQAQTPEGVFQDLAQIRSGVRSKRISSFDRTGGNNDRFERIPDGERRTLFEVEGAGMINHI